MTQNEFLQSVECKKKKNLCPRQIKIEIAFLINLTWTKQMFQERKKDIIEGKEMEGMIERYIYIILDNQKCQD